MDEKVENVIIYRHINVFDVLNICFLIYRRWKRSNQRDHKNYYSNRHKCTLNQMQSKRQNKKRDRRTHLH